MHNRHTHTRTHVYNCTAQACPGAQTHMHNRHTRAHTFTTAQHKLTLEHRQHTHVHKHTHAHTFTTAQQKLALEHTHTCTNTSTHTHVLQLHSRSLHWSTNTHIPPAWLLASCFPTGGEWPPVLPAVLAEELSLLPFPPARHKTSRCVP